MEAKKYDQNKTRMDLVPLSVMESLGTDSDNGGTEVWGEQLAEPCLIIGKDIKQLC